MVTEKKIVDRVCPQCGKVLEETWNACPSCGRSLTLKQQSDGRTWSILSIVFGIISLLIFGIPLGIAAVICGSVAVSKNDDLGIIGIIIGVIGALLAWLILSVLF